MEGSLRELADYRMDRAKEMLHAAEDNLKIGQWKTALNRSYYAIFHAMRAVNILGGGSILQNTLVLLHILHRII